MSEEDWPDVLAIYVDGIATFELEAPDWKARERIGEHHGRWRDVIFLERRRA